MGSAPSLQSKDKVVLGEEAASKAYQKSLGVIGNFRAQNHIHSFRDEADIWAKFSQLYTDVMSMYDREIGQARFFSREAYRYRLDQVLTHAKKDVLRETQRHQRRKELHVQTEKAEEKKAEERRQERQLGMMFNDVNNRLQEKNKEDLTALKRDLVNEIKMNFLAYKLQHFQSMQICSSEAKIRGKSRKRSEKVKKPFLVQDPEKPLMEHGPQKIQTQPEIIINQTQTQTQKPQVRPEPIANGGRGFFRNTGETLAGIFTADGRRIAQGAEGLYDNFFG